MSLEEIDIGKTIKIDCIILPIMNQTTIKIRDHLTLRDFDKSFTEITNNYAKYIIFRGEVLRDYTRIIRELKIRRNDNFFIVKQNLSNTAIQTNSDLLNRILSSGYGLANGNSIDDVTVNFGLTNGVDTITPPSTNLTRLEDTLNRLFTTSTTLPTLPEEDLSNEPIPEYEYQEELEQLLNMGYLDEIEIRAALDITNGDIIQSLVYLPS